MRLRKQLQSAPIPLMVPKTRRVKEPTKVAGSVNSEYVIMIKK